MANLKGKRINSRLSSNLVVNAKKFAIINLVFSESNEGCGYLSNPVWGIDIMQMLILVILILFQIVFNFFLIVSLVVFHDQIELFGIPIHLILLFLTNVGSLFFLARVYIHAERQKIQLTETTHEEQFRSFVASVRSDRHDLNNHLTVISGLIKINNFSGAESYINEIIGEVKINNQALLVHNPVLASMLYSKMEKFQKGEISFRSNIKSEQITRLISSTDLIRLISNLLDNAYDAAMELPVGKRLIAFEMTETDQELQLIVKNASVNSKLDEKLFKPGMSTKATDKSRGFGLSIIQEVANRYGGSFLIKNENQLIVSYITFPKGDTDDYPNKQKIS
ncbi:sensor histidine kinase [Cytobacillus sp. FJAT-53684]|uniref:Sensor histidine kinase n=1 Tax=Cytobacillus mangrovibacter TaxID=3299024 RepID=A0ABW6JZ31_9BACI